MIDFPTNTPTSSPAVPERTYAAARLLALRLDRTTAGRYMLSVSIVNTDVLTHAEDPYGPRVFRVLDVEEEFTVAAIGELLPFLAAAGGLVACIESKVALARAQREARDAVQQQQADEANRVAEQARIAAEAEALARNEPPPWTLT